MLHELEVRLYKWFEAHDKKKGNSDPDDLESVAITSAITAAITTLVLNYLFY